MLLAGFMKMKGGIIIIMNANYIIGKRKIEKDLTVSELSDIISNVKNDGKIIYSIYLGKAITDTDHLSDYYDPNDDDLYIVDSAVYYKELIDIKEHMGLSIKRPTIINVYYSTNKVHLDSHIQDVEKYI